MKKNITLIALIFIFIFIKCSTISKLEQKTNKIINEQLIENNKIYALKSTELKKNIICYYKENDLVYQIILPNKIEVLKLQKEKDIYIHNDSILKYFEMNFSNNEYNCFHHEDHHALAYDIYIFEKEKKTLISGVNLDCLFTKKFHKNTMPYKFQKLIYPILKPSNFDFKNMTPIDITSKP